MIKDETKKSVQKILQDMNKVNEEVGKFLQEIDRKIAEIDLRYIKMIVKEEINTLEISKKILEAGA